MEQKIMTEARAEYLSGSKDVGILVIHGFTGTTQSMRPVAYALHEKGYSVNMPRLKGHGTTPEDMETCTYQDWIESVSTAYNDLKKEVKEVFVLGLSMGGTLTLYSAIHFDIQGAIVINGAIDIPEFEARYNNPETPRFMSGVGSDIKKPNTPELAYDKTPKKSVLQIVSLCKEVKKDLSKITCPLLVLSSTIDHVVPPINERYIFDHVGSKDKEFVELKNSYHVATLDNDFDIIVSKTLDFITKYK